MTSQSMQMNVNISESVPIDVWIVVKLCLCEIVVLGHLGARSNLAISDLLDKHVTYLTCTFNKECTKWLLIPIKS